MTWPVELAALYVTGPKEQTPDVSLQLTVKQQETSMNPPADYGLFTINI